MRIQCLNEEKKEREKGEEKGNENTSVCFSLLISFDVCDT